MIEEWLVVWLKVVVALLAGLDLVKMVATGSYLETVLLLVTLVFFVKIMLRTQGLFECQLCMIASIILLLVSANSELHALLEGQELGLHFERWGFLAEMGLHWAAVLAEWRLYQLIKLKRMHDLQSETDPDS